MGKRRKHIAGKPMKPEEIRRAMEAKLRAQTIPSGKKYKRKPKHKREEF